MLDALSELYSSDVRTRVSAAAQYTVFSSGGEPPAAFRTSWLKTMRGRVATSGRPWPSELTGACAAGTAWRTTTAQAATARSTWIERSFCTRTH